ncbi:MAG: efflux RND transporter permease subunit [Myxococcota bacterium]|nr:efflux RND transporter permease subunit [Myxococcota bacterium]
MTPNPIERYGQNLVRHRGIMLAAIVLLTIASSIGIWNRVSVESPVDFTPQSLFMSNGAEWERLQAYESEFGVEDNTMIVIVDGPVNSREGIGVLEDLHRAVDSLPDVVSVDSILTASIAGRDAAGMIEVREAADATDAPLLSAMSDPFLSPMLVAPDGSAAVLHIEIDESLQTISELAPAVWRINEAILSTTTPSDYSLHVTGVPFIRAEVVEMMLADQGFFFPLVTTVFLITIVALFKRFWVGVAPMVGVLVATIWTMGVLLSSGATLNILSILTPTLVLVIGVADGIHLVSRYREELAHHDGDRAVAMGVTVRRMALACFLTTFTTGAGFASLVVAQTKVIRDFGLQVACGVTLTFFAVMVVVPTLLAWIPVARIGSPAETNHGPAYRRLTRFVTHHPRRIIVGALGLTVLAFLAGQKVYTNSHLLEMYRPGQPTWQAVKLAEEKTGGVIPIFIHIDGAEDQMLDPTVLRRIGELEAELRSFPLAGTTVSIAGWVQHIHRMLTDEAGWPDSRAVVAQELLLAELTGDLPLERVISPDRARARVLAFTRDAGGREFLRVKQTLEAKANTLFRGTGIEVEVTGDGMLASHGVDQLIRDLLASLGLMFIVIVATMWSLLRDVRQTIIATIPNIIPLIFILGTLGILGADLETSNIVSFTVAVGLAVDDTIHFIVRYREERNRGAPVQESISRTFIGAGHAIVLTSILLIAGFGILAFSPLTSTHYFGLLACITMAAAMLGDLLLLPALFTWLDQDGPGNPSQTDVRRAH